MHIPARTTRSLSSRLIGTALLAGALAVTPLTATAGTSAAGAPAAVTAASAGTAVSAPDRCADDAPTGAAARLARPSGDHGRHGLHEPNVVSRAEAGAMDRELERRVAKLRDSGPGRLLSARAAASTTTVSVYFHVVHDGAAGRLTTAEIAEQMAVLNAAFAGQGEATPRAGSPSGWCGPTTRTTRPGTTASSPEPTPRRT